MKTFILYDDDDAAFVLNGLYDSFFWKGHAVFFFLKHMHIKPFALHSAKSLFSSHVSFHHHSFFIVIL